MRDVVTIASAIGALKPTFDALRSAMGLLKDAKDLLPAGDKRESAISQALMTAKSSAKIAEAEVAKALGYELCKCEFPPIPMLTVGFIDNKEVGLVGPVYECPKCGYNSARMWHYTRITPPREK